MLLESLSLYSNYNNEVTGIIKFKGEHGTVELRLTQEQCQKLLFVVADLCVESAKEVAIKLTAEVISSSNLLEQKD